MAQERLQYYIPSTGGGANNGRQVDVTFTYDETAPLNSDGTVTVTGIAAGSTYSVIGDTGNVIRTDNITGLGAANSYQGNDNHLRIGAQPYVTNKGITYIISNFADSNGTTGYVNFFKSGGTSNTYFEAGSNQTPATVIETACFATGTSIRTARGDVAVEDLVVGDRAVTASGALRPITWIGHRDLDGAGRALPHDQQPVRVRAGAFGPGLPERDLRFSPGHPVLVGGGVDGEGGVLVPIMCLINGTSIAREVTATSVTYWHVELDSHDILLAEGLPAESYFDMGSRAWFSGADDVLSDPDLVPVGEHGRCRPVAIDGPVVEAERLRIDAVFAAELASHGDWNDADGWLAA